jgi:cell division protein FtsB
MTYRRKYRIKWFRLSLLLLAGFFVYNLANQQIELNAINRETEATRARLEQLKQQNNTLVEEKVRLTTPAHVEKLAREELGLVKPGEVPYIPAEKR